MRKRSVIIAAALGIILAGLVTSAAAQNPGEPFASILAKLDQLLAATQNFSVDLRGVTQNWDKALPANDPGGPCPSGSSRFTCVLDGAAVRDNQTGLVWEQAPDQGTSSWDSARYLCVNHTTGGQQGWRLPSVQELGSLVDPNQTNPALPPGHPFSNIVTGFNQIYWSATTDALAPGGSTVWVVSFSDGLSGVAARTEIPQRPTPGAHLWCVRGGINADMY